MSLTTNVAGGIEAIDARFQERRGQVPVLGRRAAEAGVTAIRSPEDLVPLLFPHTTYKSYPESLVTKGRWAQLNRWLASLSVHRVDVDVTGVEDVDGWINRLEEHGHLITASSGTTGKSSFLNKSWADRRTSEEDLIRCLSAQDLPPDTTWHVMPVGPATAVSQHVATRELIIRSYGRPDAVVIDREPAPEGHHRYMARLSAMRRAMGDGTASPDAVAAFEAEGAQRRAALEGVLHRIAGALLAHRTERVFFTATFPLLHRLCEILRDLGCSEGDLSGENALMTGGGLKGTALPTDYREQIFRLLNISPERFLHYYSMSELNLRMPKCPLGRYHVPPELTLLVLDRAGESLAPVSDGQVEGRAAFFDVTADGRWGGIMSGDHVRADLGQCPCGRLGHTVFDEITRYADLPDGDKITCAGTIDAYVRGFADED